jgi:hypothetical protein
MLTFEQLKSRDCRWPTEAQSGEVLFCGEAALNECPYCAVHADLAYTKTRRRMIIRDYNIIARNSSLAATTES